MKKGNEEAVELLLGKGADVKAVDEVLCHSTLAFLACCKQNVKREVLWELMT